MILERLPRKDELNSLPSFVCVSVPLCPVTRITFNSPPCLEFEQLVDIVEEPQRLKLPLAVLKKKILLEEFI
jgi:hypothetical protein